MKEAQLQKVVNRILKQIPGLWFYHPRETKRGTDGIPDVIGCYQGIFFAIELKSPGGDPRRKLRPEQRRVLEGIERAGGKIAVINNIDDLLNFIQSLRPGCQAMGKNRE